MSDHYYGSMSTALRSFAEKAQAEETYIAENRASIKRHMEKLRGMNKHTIIARQHTVAIEQCRKNCTVARKRIVALTL